MVGREGNEPPMSRRRLVYRQLRPMARPTHADRCGDRSLDDASAVVKVLVSRLAAGRVEAGSEGVEPPAVGVGDRGATVARAQELERA